MTGASFLQLLTVATFGAAAFLVYRAAISIGCGNRTSAFAAAAFATCGFGLHSEALPQACALALCLGAFLLAESRTRISVALWLAALAASPLAVALPPFLMIRSRRKLWLAFAGVGVFVAASFQRAAPRDVWMRWILGNVATVADLLHSDGSGRRTFYLTVAALFYIAWRRPRPELRFAFTAVLATILPFAALRERPAGAAIFLAFGASILAGSVLSGAVEFLSREPVVRYLQERREA